MKIIAVTVLPRPDTDSPVIIICKGPDEFGCNWLWIEDRAAGRIEGGFWGRLCCQLLLFARTMKRTLAARLSTKATIPTIGRKV